MIRWTTKQVIQVRRKLRVEKRVRQVKERLKTTRLGKRAARVTKKVRRLARATRGQLTFMADKLERKLPPGSRRARLLRRLRDYSPLSVGPFSYRKFKQDPVFLGAYKGASWTFGKVAPPLMFKAGAGLSASLLVPALIGAPLDLAFILGREHQLRKRANPDQTLRQTARALRREYRDFVGQRRQQNRRYHKVYTRRLWGAAPPQKANSK